MDETDLEREWQEYKAQYDKVYNPAEDSKHKEIFIKRMEEANWDRTRLFKWCDWTEEDHLRGYALDGGWRPSSPEVSHLVDGEVQLALSLLQLSETKSNLFSPFSIHSGLCLLHAVATGSAREEITDILEGTGANKIIDGDFSAKQTEKNRCQPTMSTYNVLLLRHDYPIPPCLIEALTPLHVSINSVDSKNPTPAVHTVNKAIENITNGKITETLTAADISADFCASLLTSFFFEATFSPQYDRCKTKAGDFFVDEQATIKVDYLHSQYIDMFYQDEEVQILSKSYEGDRELNFVIILPRERCGLEQLIANLTPEKLDKWLNSLERRRVDQRIPKMDLRSDVGDLVEPLKKLGIRRIFEGRLEDSQLFFNHIHHMSTLRVDEHGPALLCRGESLGMPRRVVSFTADHPFLFIVKNKKHLLIMGAMRNTTGLPANTEALLLLEEGGEEIFNEKWEHYKKENKLEELSPKDEAVKKDEFLCELKRIRENNLRVKSGESIDLWKSVYTSDWVEIEKELKNRLDANPDEADVYRRMRARSEEQVIQPLWP